MWETIVFFRYVSRCFDARVFLFYSIVLFVLLFPMDIGGFFTFAENVVFRKISTIISSSRLVMTDSLAC